MLKKGISLFLALAMAICTIPMEAVAEEFSHVNNEEEAFVAGQEIVRRDTAETAVLLQTSEQSDSQENEIVNENSSDWIVVEGITGGKIDFDESTGMIIECEQTVTSAHIPEIINGVPVTAIDYGAFSDCKQLTEVIVPEGVTSIDYGAFRRCDNLSKVILPSTLSYVGWQDSFYYPKSGAFTDCPKLISAGPIGSGCNIEFAWETKIPERAFYHCNGLEKIVIPEGICEIGDFAFLYCENLVEVSLPETLEKVDRTAFWETGIYNNTSFWENGVLYLSGWVIEASDDIQGEYTIQSGTRGIADYAFEACALNKVIMPDSIEYIGEGAFHFCPLLEEVVLSSNMDYIPLKAFAENKSLKQITIPDGIVYIEDSAFSYCQNMTGDLIIPDSVKFIHENAFYGTSFSGSLVIGDGLTEIPNVGGFTGDLVIGNGITEIPDKAFSRVAFKGKLEIGDNVSSIGNYAFQSSDFEKIVIPQSVKAIGYYNFSNCTKIEWAGPIGSDCDYEFGWTERIPENSFYGCESLTYVTIPNGIRDIGQFAFSGCNSLQALALPSSLETLDRKWFGYDSLNSLTDIYYAGSQETWEKLKSLSEDNDWLEDVDVHYNSEQIEIPPEKEKSSIAIEFLTEWDAEKQIAYFEGDLLHLGAEVTEETDTSFLDSVEKMLNQYVLVETRPRDDGMIGPDILIRMELVEAGTGTVQEYTEDSLTVNDTVYPLALREEVPVVGADKGAEVLYGVQDEKIVIIIPLTTTTMRLEDWNSASRVLTVSNNLSKYNYKVSTLASEESLAFLNASRDSDRTYSIEFASDASNKIAYRIYRIYEEPEDPEYYDTPRYETTEEALLGKYAMDWYQAYENYTEALNKALTSYAGSEDADRTSLIFAMAEDMRKKDSGSYSRYLTWNGETTATIRSAGYKALAALLYDHACSNPDFSNVDFSSTTAGTALVKAVMKSMSSTSASYSFEGVDVYLHVFQFGSEKFGNMTCTLNGKQYSAVICSTQTECYETIESYWESLKDLETQALFNIYTAVATDICGKSPTTFTKEFLKKHVEKYTSELLKVGVGDVVTGLNTCHNYYSYVNKICNGDLDNLENLLGAMGSLKFDDSSITDKAVNKAMKVLKSTTNKLNQACADYVAGTLEIPSNFSLKQLIVACPVNVLIYNAAGEQIGYVGEDDLWYEDPIRITEEGNAKIIDILSEQDISVRFIGTAAGTMSCSIEEYTVEGVPIGRLNFYQIPVQEGQELEMKVPERLTGNLQDTCIRTETENIFPNEYMTVNDAGCVSVTCSVDPQEAENGCMVSGTGSFVRGDAVVLTALSGENYNFIGWYQDGVLQSTSQVYEFPAIQDVSLSAVFAQPYQGYKVEVTAEKGGTAIGSSVFAANEMATVLASPNKGYEFDGWYVNGGKISDSAEYSFAVQADMLITASFSKISPEPEESPTPQPTETPAPYPSAEPTPQPSEAPTSVPNTTPVPQPTTTTVSEYGTTWDTVKSDDAEKTQAQETDFPNKDSSEPSQTPQANEDESSIQKSDSVVQETEEQNKEGGSSIWLYAFLALAAGCVIFGAVWYLWRRKKQ